MTPAQMFDQTTTTAKKNDVGMNARMMTEEDHNRANQHLHSFSQFQPQQQNQQHIIAMARSKRHEHSKRRRRNEARYSERFSRDGCENILSHHVWREAFSNVSCHEAIAALRTYSPEQFETGYVLTQTAERTRKLWNTRNQLERLSARAKSRRTI